MSEIIKFPDRGTSELRKMVRDVIDEELYPSIVRTGCGRPYTRRGKNMQTFSFRSSDAILAADEAELFHDVCMDIDMASRKLEKLRQRRKTVREMAVEEERRYAAVEAKLAAALVQAVLSQAERV
ncbi:hypothetical protein [Bradyrhizobium erythrophlei]|jgi:hypothetical protein|uniref:Uncharacterized protein n=1 Tax=Bradyrhizobium erythrophlei TaxID=1437360 RepID=A0A1M7UT11_9BRAD|nr:hypothetical protein [Bradyrhizobium erythrophlei]SHN86036.1 hypothetical protein SAMN05444170_6530 [Bradyrhizobium erythrophlei]